MRFFHNLFLFLISFSIYAQESTGSINGKISKIGNDKIAITLIQKSTGFKYNTTTQKNGYFVFNQLQPANDYELEISNPNFEVYKEENIQVILGKSTFIDVFLIKNDKNLEEILVKGSTTAKKNTNEKQLKSNLVTKLPTLNRSIQDATRLLPEANLNSFGGANYRFNNLSIDGVATNDVFGFQEPIGGAAGSVASGTPGGLAGTQPISFGAISALSIKTTPFDVTLGNFTGASINAVTKYGTNKLYGNAYGFLRNKDLTGNYVEGEKQQTIAFIDYQTGVSLGGPIKKDKIFYFFNAEFTFRKEPTLNVPGTEFSAISESVIQQIANKLITNYNYDPGSLTSEDIERKNTKLFARFDFNLDANNKLTIRNNFVTGYADSLERTLSVFNFGNQGYRHNTLNNTLAAELKTRFSDGFSNKLTLSHSFVNDERTFNGRVFPHLEIIDNTANNIFAGTYREAALYGLTVNTIQFTDNFTYTKDKHQFTFGVSSEINSIQYRFLTAFNGRWQYRNLADFLADRPNRVRGVYNIENNDYELNRKTPSADFGIILSSVYAQDEIRFSDKFNIIAGLRLDWQYYPGEFPISQEITNTPFYANYKNQINTSPQFNPRLGFNYKPTSFIELRGGAGLFTGRMPFLWYAYPEYISGTKYFNIDFRPTGDLPITEDLSTLETVQGKRQTEINLVDNNFSLPKDLKMNLSVDFKLKYNLNLNFEATYSKVLKGLLFQSINRKEELKSNFVGADTRPYYNTTSDAIKINTNFTNVFILTNVDDGYRYNLSANITKSDKNYNGFLGYTYGVSKDISSTIRSSHAANFEWNQALVANSPSLTYSNFDLRHKFVSYHFYEKQFGNNKLKLGLVYNGKSGSPFSYVYEGDVNRDGSAKNDILYIPRNQSEIVLQDIVTPNGTVSAQTQWQQLDAYINNDSFLSENRGKYAERNAARTPWNHQVDAKIVYERKIGTKSVEFSIDIFNLGNLINKNWGAQYFVPNVNNSSFALLDFVRIENGKPVYQFNNPQGKPWLVDTVNSRWQAQFGINVYF